MQKEILSDKQAISIMALFVIGSTIVLPTAPQAHKSLWISIILAIVAALPIGMLYARLLHLHPGQDFFDILNTVFGQVVGKALSLIFIWYALHLGALVLRNIGEFINTVGLPETPEIVPLLSMTALCIWGVKEGLEVVGRIGEFFILFILVFILITLSLMIPVMDINNARPLFVGGIKPILSGAYSALTFPFAETILFLMVLTHLQKKHSPYKVYLGGISIGGFIIFITSLASLLVLGIKLYSSTFFPTYLAVSRINIGNFIQRVEIIVAFTFLITGFGKVCICLLATSRGIAKFFNCEDYRFLVTPLGLLMALLAEIIYSNILEMTEWASNIYQYYTIPFQFILPILILIAAEIKSRWRKN